MAGHRCVQIADHGDGQRDGLGGIAQCRIERVLHFHLVGLEVHGRRRAVDAHPFSPIGRFADVAGGAVEPDHFKAGVTLVARVDGSEANGQPARIGGAGGIGDEAEALHVL